MNTRSRTPRIIHSSSHAGLLAAVPALLGQRPQESLAVVPFHGRRAVAGIRKDLWERDREDNQGTAAWCLSMLSRLGHCDATAVVVYTGSDHREAVARYRPLLHTVETHLRQEGFDSYGSFIVSATGWCEIDDAAPEGGWELDLIASEPEGGNLPDPHHETMTPAERGELPRPDPARSEAMATGLTALAVGEEITGLGVRVPARESDPVALVEELVQAPEAEPAVPGLLRLAHHVQNPAVRDQIMVQLAFGRAAGQQARRSNRRHTARMRRTGMSSDEIARRDLASGRGVAEGVSMMLGDWPHAPDPERLERATTLMAHVSAHVPEAYRPPLLCILGWLCWAAGRGSAAGAHLDAARELDPMLRMATLLTELVGSGKVPDWGLNRVDRRLAERQDRAAAA